MAARREDLTEGQLALQRAYQRSWDVAQEFLADPEKRAWLEANIERVRQSPTTANHARGLPRCDRADRDGF